MLSLLLSVLLSGPNWEVEQPNYIVKVVLKEDNAIYTSTGALISHCMVLTCHHCIDNHRTADSMTIVFKDGREVKATYVNDDTEHDVGLLRLEKPVLIMPAKIASEPAKKGDTITIQGFPKGKEYAETQGRVVNFTVNKYPSFIINDNSIQGMSGGPALNEKGEIVGVLFGSTDTESYCGSLEAIRNVTKGKLDKACELVTGE